jgi:hypothetical protein
MHIDGHGDTAHVNQPVFVGESFGLKKKSPRKITIPKRNDYPSTVELEITNII